MNSILLVFSGVEKSDCYNIIARGRNETPEYVSSQYIEGILRTKMEREILRYVHRR